MKYTISMESGSGQKFNTKEDFLKEVEMMIDDCIANGGTQFDIEVYADASCFYQEDEEEE